MTTPAPFGLAVAAALLAGIVLVQTWPALPPYLVLLLLAASGAGLYRRKGVLRLLGALLIGLAIAAAHGRWSLERQLPSELSGQPVWLVGEVLGLPSHDDDATRFELRVLTGEHRASVLAGRKLRLTWYRPNQDIQPGSQWRLQVKLRAPRGVLNPGGYDFERRALEQRISATGYVLAPQLATQIASAGGSHALRDQLSLAIAEALPASRARFVQALALGDTRGLQPRDWEILRATGLTHLIAISGFHVGMIAGWAALLASVFYRFFPALGRRLPRPQAAALAALAAAASYTALAGFALPTVRTLLMIGAVLLARLWRRPQRVGDAFALAMIAVLVVDPLSVLTPGFWLSFLGVAWLMWCLPGERNARLLPTFLKAQGIAALGLLPLTVWFFSQASLSGPIVNLFGIPWISLGVVPLAILGALVYPASESLAHSLWTAAAWLMEQLWWLLERIADWPSSLLWLPDPTPLTLLLALLAAFWLLLPRPVPGKWLAVLLLLPLLWPERDRPELAEVDIVLLDVGQGLAVLVLTKSHSLLYDAGPAPANGMDFGEAAVVPALRALSVRKLDTLLLSHGDNDHAGGADAVQRAFPNTKVLAPEGWAKRGMSICQRTQAWQWDGVDFRILHPPPLMPYQRNESSCVLRIEAAGRVALIPGDIGRHVETRLVKEQLGALAADLLIVPHHGSNTSSSGDFLEAVKPGRALFAVGADNRFGLPTAEVLQRYGEVGAAMDDSAGSGAIRVRLGSEGVHLQERYRFDRPRYWRAAIDTKTVCPSCQTGPISSADGGSGYAIAP